MVAFHGSGGERVVVSSVPGPPLDRRELRQQLRPAVDAEHMLTPTTEYRLEYQRIADLFAGSDRVVRSGGHSEARLVEARVSERVTHRVLVAGQVGGSLSDAAQAEGGCHGCHAGNAVFHQAEHAPHRIFGVDTPCSSN
jgi:hypothetical protein